MTRDARHLHRLGAALLLLALLTGCVRVASSGGVLVPTPSPTAGAAGTPPPATLPPTVGPSPTAAPTATPNDGAQVVKVSLLDSLTIEPAKITVQAGKPVRFEITNAGALEHDFFIGTDKEQKQRESRQGEPGPDRYVAVPPGESVTLTYVFPSPGKTIAGCVVPGHYSAGMKATITIR